MKFDIWFSYALETKVDDSTTTENSTRKRFTGILQSDLSSKLKELIDSVPENVTEFYLEVTPSMNDQMDAALANM